MRKNRVIGFTAAAIMALGLTAGAATTAGAFSGGGDSGSAKPTKQSGSTTPVGKPGKPGKPGDLPEGVAVEHTQDGMHVRKLTKEELENSDGAKPTKPSPKGGAADGGKTAK